MHIAGLEQQLQTTLILRSNKQKNFLLTPDGKLLYSGLKKLCIYMNEMISEIKSQRETVGAKIRGQLNNWRIFTSSNFSLSINSLSTINI